MSSLNEKVLIFGRSGQLAQGLREVFPDAQIIARSECDFENPTTIAPLLERLRPKLILNAAAYTDVDRAESEIEKAHAINALAPGEMANWSRQNRATLVHFSTDYVYGGQGDRPFQESDLATPLNQYGKSKLAGEAYIAQSDCHHLILRTSWLFGLNGHNFLKTMIRLGSKQEKLRVVEDQVGAPTAVADLTLATLKICRHPEFYQTRGVFNLVNSGETSWFAFANEIFAQIRQQGRSLKVRSVEPISSVELARPAVRPLNSRLNTEKVRAQFGVEMRSWRAALTDCLSELPSRPEFVFS